jgi:signal peptidase II
MTNDDPAELWDDGQPERRDRRLFPFATLAALVVVADQITKAWIDSSFGLTRPHPGISAPVVVPTEILGDFLRISKLYNDGAIFGTFGASAPLFAIGSAVVAVGITWYQVTRGDRGPWLLTVALGLLLGGAIGNLINRVTVGYVVDWADMGIGTWRWYIFNVADASVSISIVLLLAVSLFAERLQPRSRDRAANDAAVDRSWPTG